MKQRYIYPELSSKDYGFVRLGGAGLANNMYVVARAVVLTQKINGEMLRPTWEKFSLGPILRHEQDKRCYFGLFRKGKIPSWKKLYLLKALPVVSEETLLELLPESVVIRVTGLKKYFEDLLDSIELVQAYFREEILPSAIAGVPKSPIPAIGVHVRLGDFNPSLRINLNWYREIILQLQQAASHPLEIRLFSDGRDDELTPLLECPGVKRVFYGNALADIVALSRMQLVIGSDSTFSGWGIFLGQMPAIFSHRHYGQVHKNKENDLLLGEDIHIPKNFLTMLKQKNIL